MPETETPIPDPGADPKNGEAAKGTEGWKPPSDGSWIPRERFNDAVQRERSRADRLEAILAAERTAREEAEKKATKPSLTRAELQALVDAGTISQDQMESEMQRQMADRIRTEVTAEVTAKTRAERKAQVVKDDLRKYREAIPDLLVDGSEARSRVQKEFEYLTQMLEEPVTIETELKAVRAVFGPPDRIREITRETREADPERVGGGSGGGAQATGAGIFAGLSKAQADAYQAMIDRGLYKGHDDPNLKREIQVAVARANRRAPARA